MHLIDIDEVGAQTPQRIVDLAHDPLARRVAKHFPVAPFEADFGCDDHAIAQVAYGQCLAHDLFRAPESIRRRRIDQRDAAIDRCVNGVDRLAFVGAAPHPASDGPRA